MSTWEPACAVVMFPHLLAQVTPRVSHARELTQTYAHAYDYRFHGIKYPLRKLREQQQFEKYRAVNPEISEEDYRTMIFGPESGGNVVNDPSAEATLEIPDPTYEIIESGFRRKSYGII